MVAGGALAWSVVVVVRPCAQVVRIHNVDWWQVVAFG